MKPLPQLVVAIKGAGEIASAVACRLYQANMRKIFMLETPHPLAVRRWVCFSEAIPNGRHEVEGVGAVSVSQVDQIRHAWSRGWIGVAVDPTWTMIPALTPDVCVDAIIAKKNLGTSTAEAPLVIGLGPGFRAPDDVHMVIETQRGHNLGRIITQGCAAPDTGIPGDICGFSYQRVLKAPAEGVFEAKVAIGDQVAHDDVIGLVNHIALQAQLDGVVRGLLRTGTQVKKGCKLGDIDPRGRQAQCGTISDKARSIAGSVLEAILRVCLAPDIGR
jgi:xanthine dehydrogenase accessory factor